MFWALVAADWIHCCWFRQSITIFDGSVNVLNEDAHVNSEGFLAEVFHPWVRWEGPGSGFENSSGAGGAGGGVWVGPSWAQVGGPKLGPSGWAQARPKWGGPKLGPRGLAQAGPK